MQSNSKVSSKQPICFLFDNGSIRPDAVLHLRRVAAALAARLGNEVVPASLQHSSEIDPTTIEGRKASLVEDALLEYLRASPSEEVVLLPLYFGPSGMLSKLLQVKISKVKKQFPSAVLLTAKHLVDLDEKDERVAQALVNVINQTIVSRGVERPKVVLVDHGSPSVEVSAVRNHLGCQIRGILGGSVEHVAVASMERRPGEEYAFNEPLLASCLDREPFCRGNVIVTQQFLLPGRHAGLDGDIARICAEACARHPELRVYQTQPIATDPNVIDVLADRFWQAVGTR